MNAGRFSLSALATVIAIRRLLIGTTIVAATLGAGTAASADTDPAAAVVETLHATLLDVMQRADTIGFAGRRDVLAPIIASVFDLATVSRIVLGSHWRALNADQRQAFISRFTDLTIATYADNFDGFDGEQFTTANVAAQRNSMVVKTVLQTRTEAIPLDYVLRAGPHNDWRIVNVLAQGVSDIALKRAEYGAVINADGFDALLGKIDGKIAALGTKP